MITAIFMHNKSSFSKLATALALASSMVLTTSCSTVSFNQQKSSQTIANNRGNIVTRPTLSNKSASQLLSIGMPDNECLDDFNKCLVQIDKGFLKKDSREYLALLAELHLAKAKSIAESEQCVERVVRPPIDPYYANAPLTEEQQAESLLYLKQCNAAYRDNLLSAIKYSYAYLFYSQLNPNTRDNDNTLSKPKTLLSSLDIQTQDVYEAASDALIKQLYANKDSSQQSSKVTSFISSELVRDSGLSSRNGSNYANGPKYGEQIKVLNFTFPPIQDDKYLASLARDNLSSTDLAKEGADNNNDNNENGITKDSIVEDSIVEDSIIEDSIIEDSIIEDSTVKDSAVEDSTVKDSTVKDSAVEDSTVGVGSAKQNDAKQKDAKQNFDSDDSNPVDDKEQAIKEFEALNENQDTVSIDLYLPNEPEYLQNTETYNKSIDKLYASHDISFSGLNTISEREGVGISYVTLFDDRPNTSVKALLTSDNKQLNSEDPRDRIHLTGNLLLTGVVIPEGDQLQDVLATNNFDIKLYNPHHTEAIDILGKPYYLAANFSASYGMWLAENNLDNVGYFNLLARQKSLIMPQLFMLEPYDPNKRIIIMLHGLASSPATWISITNDISNDDELRENYQVWQIFYPTNIPILENRYRIQELIETAYKINDPNSEHIASHNSVLIGHSMGAVISRMMVSNDNLQDQFDKLAQEEDTRRLSNMLNNEFDQQKVLNRLHLKQLDSVDTAVFISAPFRGTDFADRWFTQLLRRVVQLPIGFVQTVTGNLASLASEGELASNPLGALYFQNGASQLSDKSSFMKLTADLKIADNVTYHSIIANRDSDLYNGLIRLNLTTAPDTALSSDPAPKVLKAGVSPDIVGEDSTATPDGTQGKAASTEANAAEKVKDVVSDVAQTITAPTSDGIVPYKSSHLEGAASETIIKGGHSIQDTPEAVLTLRKILHQHLKDHPTHEQEMQKEEIEP